MGEPGRDFDLTEEPLGTERGGDLGPEDLDGDGAAVAEITCWNTVAIPPCPSSRSSA